LAIAFILITCMHCETHLVITKFIVELQTLTSRIVVVRDTLKYQDISYIISMEIFLLKQGIKIVH